MLYKYSDEEDEAQLVVPGNERELILKELHDDPTAVHYEHHNAFVGFVQHERTLEELPSSIILLT